MRQSTYLDYNATQPLKPAVRECISSLLGKPANASSIHGFGQEARRRIEGARAQVASLIGADSSEIVFTASATEANATALRGVRAERVLISAIEHPSVCEAIADAQTIPVNSHGIVDLPNLDRMLAARTGRTLVSIMLVNNETGAIQPIAEAARIAHAHGALLHSDAAQAPGRIPVNVNALGVDLLTLSAHKIGGPQGAGALYIRHGVDVVPLLRGGGQEGRRRAGTENIAAIAGFGVAASLVSDDLGAQPGLAALRDGLEARLLALAPDLIVHGAAAPRTGNTSCFGAPGLSAETALIALDLAGVAVSSGAACSSGAVAPSRVLLAMGVGESVAREAIRVSLGWATEPEDIDRLVEAWAIAYRARAVPTV